MELYLIAPLTPSTRPLHTDEFLNGKHWRLAGPLSTKAPSNLKFHCVSYVWGQGTEAAGSFFGCQREISDQTRPALEAAVKANEAAYGKKKLEGKLKDQEELVEFFWIDALCIPQLEGEARARTLASMGFIYNAATSVVIVLQRPVWGVIEAASMEESPIALTQQQMEVLERDTWISRVWTYQELMNGREEIFTTTNLGVEGHFVPAENFFDCIGFSLARWKAENKKTASDVLDVFPNLNTLEDTLVDTKMAQYLEWSALSVLSHMSWRNFDSKYPQNRLLAGLGVLTKDVSWGPPSTTVEEIAGQLMSICEERNDYSFIFTADRRDETPGFRWRPDPKKGNTSVPRPVHLIPILSWTSYGIPFGDTQKGRHDENGFWLQGMIHLKPSSQLSDDAREFLETWLYGIKEREQPQIRRTNFFRREDYEDTKVDEVMLKAIQRLGFTGCPEAQVCNTGLFFSQMALRGLHSVELFAAWSVQWVFGSPGLARWLEAGEMRYCAGVFAGISKFELAEPLLML